MPLAAALRAGVLAWLSAAPFAPRAGGARALSDRGPSIRAAPLWRRPVATGGGPRDPPGPRPEAGGAARRARAGGGAGRGPEREGERPGLLFALGMISTVALLSVILSLALSSDGLISMHTWAVIDNVIAIFLAVTVFQAFDDILNHYLEAGHHLVITSVVYAFLLLSVAVWISWLLKDTTVSLAVFCGAAAHYVSFASMHMALVITEHYLTGSLVHVFLGSVVLTASFAILGMIIYQVKRATLMEKDGWDEQASDLENDFFAMSTAVVWTMAVCRLVYGHNVRLEVEPNEVRHHSWTERTVLLGYAALLITIGGMILRRLSALETESLQLRKRALMFVSSLTSMSAAWAMLLWGQWTFYQDLFQSDPIFGRIVFAILMSLCTAVGIVILTRFHPAPEGAALHEIKVALLALSLIVGWSWEQSFDAAVEEVAEEFELSAHHPKMWLALALALVVLPTYSIHLKPIVMEKNVLPEG